MKHRFANILLESRGDESRAKFASRLGLSYTFVREMELGNRLPSDKILIQIALTLETPLGPLFQAVYCDRSPGLAAYLEGSMTPGSIAPELATEQVGAPAATPGLALSSKAVPAGTSMVGDFGEASPVQSVSA